MEFLNLQGAKLYVKTFSQEGGAAVVVVLGDQKKKNPQGRGGTRAAGTGSEHESVDSYAKAGKGLCGRRKKGENSGAQTVVILKDHTGGRLGKEP